MEKEVRERTLLRAGSTLIVVSNAGFTSPMKLRCRFAAGCDKLPNGSSRRKSEPISEWLVRRSYPSPHQQRRDVMKALLSVLTAACIALAAGAPAAAQSTL